jgi:hypothetical protein
MRQDPHQVPLDSCYWIEHGSILRWSTPMIPVSDERSEYTSSIVFPCRTWLPPLIEDLYDSSSYAPMPLEAHRYGPVPRNITVDCDQFQRCFCRSQACNTSSLHVYMNRLDIGWFKLDYNVMQVDIVQHWLVPIGIHSKFSSFIQFCYHLLIQCSL